MNSFKKLISILLLLSTLGLASCSSAQPVVTNTQAPTADLGIVRTEAAQTVVAQITADALLHPTATQEPTATPIPPTATEVPATSTPIVILTATKTAVSSSGGTGGSGGGSFYPTNTGTPYTDSATIVGFSPLDGVTMQPGQDFDASWTFKNTGVRDWNTQFYIKYLSGNLEPKNKIYMLPEAVKRGGSITMTADFVAPHDSGRYTSNWALINDDGVAIFHMYVLINVP